MRELKTITIILTLLACVLVLAFAPHTVAPIPPGRVVVHYWEHWSGAEAEAMQGIVNDFNATVGAQKNIYVDFLSQSNINQKTLLASAAGVPPDVAGLWDQPLPQWAALDALEPLDDLARTHGITGETYKAVYWKGCHYQGKLVALLSTPNDLALLWNKQAFADHADALKAAGLDPARAPRTLAELDRYAAALHQFDATGRLLAVGYLPTEPGWYMAQTPLWFGATLYDENTGRFTLDSPETVAAFHWVAEYSRKLTAHTINDFHAAQGAYPSASNPFLTGQLMMQLQGPWVATVIEQFKPAMNGVPATMTETQTPAQRAAAARWGAGPFPSTFSSVDQSDDERINTAVTWCGFDALVIPRGAKHKAEAFEFIAYVQQQDVMEKLCAAHRKGTPLRQHSAKWYETHPNPYAEMFDRLAASPRAMTVPPVPTWPESVDAINAAFTRVAALEQTPEQACANLQATLQAKLDQFRERHPEK